MEHHDTNVSAPPKPVEKRLEQLELQNLTSKMCRLEQAMLQIESSAASQISLLQEVHLQLGSNLTNILSEIQQLKGTNSSGTLSQFRPAPILKKKVRTEEEPPQNIPVPSESPRKLGVLPGELKEDDDEEEDMPWPPLKSSSRRRGSRVKELQPGKHAATVEELSGMMARQLLRGRSSSLRDYGFDDLRDGEPMQSLGIATVSEERTRSKQSSKDLVLEKTQKLSLDELRQNHDAQVSSRLSPRDTCPVDENFDLPTALPSAAKCWLGTAGIRRPRASSCSWLWICFLLVICLTATCALIWFTSLGLLDLDISVTTIFYMASVVASIWMLGDVRDFLSDYEHGLDLYAWNAGFINEWRRKSRGRLLETSSYLLFIFLLRGLVYLQVDPSLEDLVLSISFCFASVGFMAVAYLELHIFSGLELAIDSFSVTFFRAMDVEEALAEWNVLQAMLRHVSAKLSLSLLLLGCASLASILYLIEVSFVRTDEQGGFSFVLQNLWTLPASGCLLYTLMRAAQVTEKASRVSPLVNSWHFENSDGPADLPRWMDLGRQYVVQYIIQSEAGFYIQGVRLRIFQVSKICYYFMALLFAVVSQIAT